MYNESLKKLVIFSGIHLLSSGAFHRSELGGLHPLSFQVVCILSSGIPIDLYFPLVAFRGPNPFLQSYMVAQVVCQSPILSGIDRVRVVKVFDLSCLADVVGIPHTSPTFGRNFLEIVAPGIYTSNF